LTNSYYLILVHIELFIRGVDNIILF